MSNGNAPPGSTELDLHGLYRAIGALEAQNAVLLRRSADHDEETKLIREGISELKVSVAGVRADLATAMPVVRRVQKWEQRAIGISLVGGLLGGGLLAQIKGWFG